MGYHSILPEDYIIESYAAPEFLPNPQENFTDKYFRVREWDSNTKRYIIHDAFKSVELIKRILTYHKVQDIDTIPFVDLYLD